MGDLYETNPDRPQRPLRRTRLSANVSASLFSSLIPRHKMLVEAQHLCRPLVVVVDARTPTLRMSPRPTFQSASTLRLPRTMRLRVPRLGVSAVAARMLLLPKSLPLHQTPRNLCKNPPQRLLVVAVPDLPSSTKRLTPTSLSMMNPKTKKKCRRRKKRRPSAVPLLLSSSPELTIPMSHLKMRSPITATLAQPPPLLKHLTTRLSHLIHSDPSDRSASGTIPMELKSWLRRRPRRRVSEPAEVPLPPRFHLVLLHQLPPSNQHKCQTAARFKRSKWLDLARMPRTEGHPHLKHLLLLLLFLLQDLPPLPHLLQGTMEMIHPKTTSP